MVEQRTENPCVPGSIPGGTTQKESYSDVALFCFYAPRILLAHTFPAISQKLSIRKHINNVFSEGELEKENDTHFLRVDGVKQPVAFYSLDVIISIDYRVKSQRGTQFRIWANRILKDYLVKGYAVNKALTEQRYTELKQLVTVLGRTGAVS